MTLPKLARDVFARHSSVSFIEGKKGDGKTDFAFRLGEEGFKAGLFEFLASNVNMRFGSVSEIPVSLIKDIDSLEEWAFNNKGKKLFVLDEFGRIAKRRRFSSKINIKMLDLFQIIRKYDLHLILIAPHYKFVDSVLEGTDILDFHVVKKSLKVALLRTPQMKYAYEFYNIKPTTIPFDTKDVASFFEANPNDPDKVKKYEYEIQIALRYANGETMGMLSKAEKKDSTIIKRLIKAGILRLQEKTTLESSHSREVNMAAKMTVTA